MKKLTVHHRKPRSHGGSNESRNKSLVTYKKHEAFHYLFMTKDSKCMTPFQIADELNNTWIDPDYKIIVITNHIVDKNQLRLFA